MKGATQLLGSMNRSMNLPALQRIAMDFERENDIMDQRQEMFEEATDDIGLDDEEESDEIVNQVLDEIGVDLGQSVRILFRFLHECSTNNHSSSEKHLLVSARTLSPKVESPKLLVAETPRTMICKQD
jgi:division protein CdvB (Snf7/Vps24/ESCRT-III family)